MIMGLIGMCFRLLVLLTVATATAASTTTQLAQTDPDDCHKCGDFDVPYPFGTKPGCYLNGDFFINCTNAGPDSDPKPLSGNIIVTSISLEGRMQIQSFVSNSCYYQNGTLRESNWASLSLVNMTVSDAQNKFTVIGCDSYAYIRGMIGNKSYREGCVSSCDSIEDVTDGFCSGSGCCQIDIPKGLTRINVTSFRFNDRQYVLQFNPCTYAFVIDNSQFRFSSSNLSKITEHTVPTWLDWAITGQGKCRDARNNHNYACKENALCYEAEEVNNSAGGYLCKCQDGYEGNPYVTNGCQDIDECGPDGDHTCSKHSQCVNTQGNYTCKCDDGYYGDGQRDGEGCIANQLPVTQIVLGVSLGFVAIVVGSSWLYFIFRKRRLIKLKENFFQQNGGFLLQQQLAERTGAYDTAKIFNADELKKATNNFDETRVIGRGGYGTVYKGFLIDNNIPIAIKKSKIVDQGQIEQFINEVTVLSQINHRNVVKLLGCCLETEVPLLVYEYINNGTLFDHIHDKDNKPTIPWETRLRIAAETAGVLSYLHSAAATPIIHRDVKSTNILLDDNLTAKVSDFGASKLVPMDVTQLSTMVQGTLGYLDPEYLHTSQLTEKSDVYSFGVVVVELMTGKKVVSFDRPEEERSLVMYFLSSLKEGRLPEILENGIMNDGNREQMKEVAELAKRCLRVKGEERPTMKEVAMELEGLIRMNKHLWDSDEVNVEETEHLLSQASYDCNYGDGSKSTAAYDSMKDHVLAAYDGGR